MGRMSKGVTTGLYLIKVCLAAFITYWLALRLELPSPRTTLITVFIVMQPQSGSVIAKGVYRLLGTFVGLTVTVLLIALFGQQGELYLGCLALWVGLCCMLSARQRNFTAYAFVLAGYTAAIVGLPALAHPEGVFVSALWRAIEVSLAIICSSLVSALVFPEHAAHALRDTLRKRFTAFNQFVCASLGEADGDEPFIAANRRFVSDALRLENLRSLSVFEDPGVRQRSGRLQRLNAEFMIASTAFNLLLHWRQHLRQQRRDQALRALAPALAQLEQLLSRYQAQVFSAAVASEFAKDLEAFQARLADQVGSADGGSGGVDSADVDSLDVDSLDVDSPDVDSADVDSDTAFELLAQFCHDLHDYALTHASLADQVHEREAWAHPFAPSTALWVSLAAGIRGMLVVATCSLFWVATAYASGVPMVLSASAAVSLTAAAPNPHKAGLQMGIGALLGAALGTLETFLVFPMIDGFAMLCAALTPVFMLGAWLTTRLQTFGIGLGMLIVFASGGVPDNLTVYDPVPFINDYLATVLAFLLCAAASAVILPPNARWMWRHLQAQLRGQLRFALEGPLTAVRSHFESRTRDILQHASGLTVTDPATQQRLMNWWLSVQAVGHALVVLRLDSADTRRDASQQPGRSLIRAFEEPSASNRQRALTAVEEALEQPQWSPRSTRYLHLIRAALLDEQSPLARSEG
jgi:uncharacterized membrane protein YccC